jgi:hypothetical protein
MQRLKHILYNGQTGNYELQKSVLLYYQRFQQQSKQMTAALQSAVVPVLIL